MTAKISQAAKIDDAFSNRCPATGCHMTIPDFPPDDFYLGVGEWAHRVVVPHGSNFQVTATNGFKTKAQFDLEIDGMSMGSWLFEPEEVVILERPAHTASKFVAYHEELAAAAEHQATDKAPCGTGIKVRAEDNGLVKGTFKAVKTLRDECMPNGDECMPDGPAKLDLCRVGCALRGHAAQVFTQVPAMPLDESCEPAVLQIRLVGDKNEAPEDMVRNFEKFRKEPVSRLRSLQKPPSV